jgi:hypothetical protein
MPRAALNLGRASLMKMTRRTHLLMGCKGGMTGPDASGKLQAIIWACRLNTGNQAPNDEKSLGETNWEEIGLVHRVIAMLRVAGGASDHACGQ